MCLSWPIVTGSCFLHPSLVPAGRTVPSAVHPSHCVHTSIVAFVSISFTFHRLHLYMVVFFFFHFWAEQHGLCDLTCPTRDQTQGPGSESDKSQPLDHQESPDSGLSQTRTGSVFTFDFFGTWRCAGNMVDNWVESWTKPPLSSYSSVRRTVSGVGWKLWAQREMRLTTWRAGKPRSSKCSW